MVANYSRKKRFVLRKRARARFFNRIYLRVWNTCAVVAVITGVFFSFYPVYKMVTVHVRQHAIEIRLAQSVTPVLKKADRLLPPRTEADVAFMFEPVRLDGHAFATVAAAELVEPAKESSKEKAHFKKAQAKFTARHRKKPRHHFVQRHKKPTPAITTATYGG